MAYLGTRFIATRESLAEPANKDMLVSTRANDIVYTPNISGINANFLRPSIKAAGLDPDNLPAHGQLDMANEAKAWKGIWSAGHGVGTIGDIPSAAELCERLVAEYRGAMAAAGADEFAG
jgi:nitronate monooxygenase